MVSIHLPTTKDCLSQYPPSEMIHPDEPGVKRRGGVIYRWNTQGKSMAFIRSKRGTKKNLKSDRTCLIHVHHNHDLDLPRFNSVVEYDRSHDSSCKIIPTPCNHDKITTPSSIQNEINAAKAQVDVKIDVNQEHDSNSHTRTIPVDPVPHSSPPSISYLSNAIHGSSNITNTTPSTSVMFAPIALIPSTIILPRSSPPLVAVNNIVNSAPPPPPTPTSTAAPTPSAVSSDPSHAAPVISQPGPNIVNLAPQSPIASAPPSAARHTRRFYRIFPRSSRDAEPGTANNHAAAASELDDNGEPTAHGALDPADAHVAANATFSAPEPGVQVASTTDNDACRGGLRFVELTEPLCSECRRRRCRCGR